MAEPRQPESQKNAKTGVKPGSTPSRAPRAVIDPCRKKMSSAAQSASVKANRSVAER